MALKRASQYIVCHTSRRFQSSEGHNVIIAACKSSRTLSCCAAAHQPSRCSSLELRQSIRAESSGGGCSIFGAVGDVVHHDGEPAVDSMLRASLTSSLYRSRSLTLADHVRVRFINRVLEQREEIKL